MNLLYELLSCFVIASVIVAIAYKQIKKRFVRAEFTTSEDLNKKNLFELIADRETLLFRINAAEQAEGFAKQHTSQLRFEVLNIDNKIYNVAKKHDSPQIIILQASEIPGFLLDRDKWQEKV